MAQVFKWLKPITNKQGPATKPFVIKKDQLIKWCKSTHGPWCNWLQLKQLSFPALYVNLLSILNATTPSCLAFCVNECPSINRFTSKPSSPKRSKRSQWHHALTSKPAPGHLFLSRSTSIAQPAHRDHLMHAMISQPFYIYSSCHNCFKHTSVSFPSFDRFQLALICSEAFSSQASVTLS